MAFFIGDQVKIKNLSQVKEDMISCRRQGDPAVWTKRKSDTEGCTGVIVDKMYSESREKHFYSVRLDKNNLIPAHYYTDDDLEPYKADKQLGNDDFDFEITLADNLVYCVVYEVVDGQKEELTRGHGHVFHEGIHGVVQAASYAIKKAWENINGGSL
jgi:hypothetical protein